MSEWLYNLVDEKGKIQNKYVDFYQFQSDYQYTSLTRRFEYICNKVVRLLAISKDDYEFWQGLQIPSYAEFKSLKVRNIDNQNTFVDLIDQNGNIYPNLFHFSFWQIQGVTTQTEKWNNEQKFYTTTASFFILCDFLLQNFVVTDYSFEGVQPLAYYTKSVTDEKISVVDNKFNNYYEKTYINTELKKIDDKLILLSNCIGSSNEVTELSVNVVNLLSIINSLVSKIDSLVSGSTEQNNNTKIDETQFSELKELLKVLTISMLGGVK